MFLKWPVDVYPSVLGGKQEFTRFIDYHMVYPESSRKLKKEGDVVINFILTDSAKVLKPSIVKSVDVDIDKEAMRLFKMLEWNPAIYEGRKVSFNWTCTFKFKLSKYKKAVKLRGYDMISPETIHDTTSAIAQNENVGYEYFYGQDSLSAFIVSQFEYPKLAKLQSLEGKVEMSFIIEKSGLPSNICVTKDLGGGCNEEATRILGLLRFKPVYLNQNSPVRFRTKYVFVFSLNAAMQDNFIHSQRGDGY